MLNLSWLNISLFCSKFVLLIILWIIYKIIESAINMIIIIINIENSAN